MGQTVELGIKINVDGNREAVSSIDEVTQSTVKMGASADNVSQSMAAAQTGLGNSTAQLTIGQLHFIDSLRDQAAAAGLTKTQLLEMQAAEMGLSDVSAGLIAQIEAATASHTKFSLASAGATRELAVLGREIASGNVDRLAGSMTVLASRTGLLPALLSPVGLAIAAIGAAVIGFGVAVFESEQQQDELQKALDVTGNMAGQTRDSMNTMAADIQTSATGGVGAATTMLTGLAATGKFTGGALAAVGHTALEFGELTGKSSEQAIQYFASMTDGVAAWADKANQSYHFMDAAQYEHIVTLEKEGKSQQAVIEVMHLMDAEMATHKENVGFLTASYRGWGMIIDGVTAALKRVVFPSIGEQVKKAIADLNDLQTKLAASQKLPGNGSISAQLAQDVAAQRKKVHDLIAQSNSEEIAAAKKQDDDLSALRGVAAQKDLDQIKQGLQTKEQLRAGAEAKIRADAAAINADAAQHGKAIVETAEQVNALVAASNAKYADNSAQAQQIAAQKNQDALRQIALKSLADDISTELQRGQITKAVFDMEMTQNAQQSNASKQRYEQAVLQISGLSAAERQAHAYSLAQLKAQAQAIEEGGVNKWLVDQDALYGNIAKAIEQTGAAESSQLDTAIAKQKQHNAEIGQTATQKELVLKKIAAEKLADSESYAQYLREMIASNTLDGNALAIDNMLLASTEKKIAKQRELIALKSEGAALDAAVEQKKIDTQQFKDAVTAAKTMETELTASFGNIGTAIGQMTLAFVDYGKTQNDIQTKLKTQLDAANGDQVVMQDARDKANHDSAAAQIKQYGDVAGAASQFFDKSSKGYKAMQDVQKVYRLAEIAMTLESTAKQVWGVATAVAAHIAGEGAKTDATVAGTAIQLATDQAKGASAGAVAIVTQGQGDPYSAWVRMAAMAAAVAALGFAVAGGSSSAPDPNSAAQQQANQGTGTVLGDAKKQSDSVSASLKLLANNSSAMLPLTSQMASSLKNIENGIAGVANIVAGNGAGILNGTNFNGNSAGQRTNSLTGTAVVAGAGYAAGTVFGEEIGSLLGPLGALVGGVVGSVVGKLWGSSSSSVTDSGLQIGGSVGQLENGQGVNQYANVQTNSSSWFGLSHSSSDSTQTASAGDAINQQFGLIFKGLQSTLETAGTELGKSSADVGTAVSNFVIDTTKISLKGLTGTALTDAINAVISAAMDNVSKSVFPQLTAFQQVGEGYTQTVVRVATGIEQAQVALQALGVTAVNYTNIIDKQGDVGAEIVRQSIDAVETATNGTLTGVGKIIQTASGAASDLASLYQSMLSIRTLMNDTALNGQHLGASMIQGAGGTSQLSQGLSDYLKNYFSPAEQSAAELKDLAAQFAALNETMPTSKDGFRALVSSIDTSTDAGQQLVGKILTLSGAFSDAVDHANALTTATVANTQAQQHALDEQLMQAQGDTAGYTAATRADVLSKLSGNLLATQEAIYAAQDQTAAITKANSDKAAAVTKATNDLTAAYNAQASSLNSTITSMQAFASSISTFKDSLTLGANSTLSPEERYNTARDIYQRTLTAAQSGDTTAQQQLQTNATAFLDASKAYNASSEAYSKDFNAVQKDMSGVANWASQQASAAQAQLAILNAQVSSLVTINTSVLSVQQAIQNLSLAQSSGAGAGGVSAAGSSTGFSGLTGVAAKAAAEAAAAEAADPSRASAIAAVYSPQALADIASGKVWSEADFGQTYMAAHTAANNYQYVPVNGSHANGLESVPFDGYIGELHRGEAVIDAPAMAAMRRYFSAPATPAKPASPGGDNSETIAELRKQNAHLSALVQLHSAGYQQVLAKLSDSASSLDGIHKKAKLEAAR